MSATTKARLHGARHGAGQRDQLVDRHRKRRVVAEHVVAGRVAHEQEVDARRVEDRGGEHVVAREPGDRDALLLRVLEMPGANPLDDGVCHGVSLGSRGFRGRFTSDEQRPAHDGALRQHLQGHDEGARGTA